MSEKENPFLPVESAMSLAKEQMKKEDLRASNNEREVVVETLKEATVEGRLSMDELDGRTQETLSAQTISQLNHALSGLPTRFVEPETNLIVPEAIMTSLAKKKPAGLAATHSPGGGMSLLELGIVFLILGILFAIAAPAFLGQQQKARNASAAQSMTIASQAIRAEQINLPNASLNQLVQGAEEAEPTVDLVANGDVRSIEQGQISIKRSGDTYTFAQKDSSGGIHIMTKAPGKKAVFKNPS